MTKSERHKLAINKRKWDRELRPFDNWFKRTKKKTMKFLENAFDWYFFYDKRKDKGDKAYHIFLWIFVTWLLLRVLGII